MADFEIKSLPALQRHARAGANRRDGPAEDRAWIHCDAPDLHQKAPGRVIRLGATHSTRSYLRLASEYNASHIGVCPCLHNVGGGGGGGGETLAHATNVMHNVGHRTKEGTNKHQPQRPADVYASTQRSRDAMVCQSSSQPLRLHIQQSLMFYAAPGIMVVHFTQGAVVGCFMPGRQATAHVDPLCLTQPLFPY